MVFKLCSDTMSTQHTQPLVTKHSRSSPNTASSQGNVVLLSSSTNTETSDLQEILQGSPNLGIVTGDGSYSPSLQLACARPGQILVCRTKCFGKVESMRKQAVVQTQGTFNTFSRR